MPLLRNISYVVDQRLAYLVKIMHNRQATNVAVALRFPQFE